MTELNWFDRNVGARIYNAVGSLAGGQKKDVAMPVVPDPSQWRRNVMAGKKTFQNELNILDKLTEGGVMHRVAPLEQEPGEIVSPISNATTKNSNPTIPQANNVTSTDNNPVAPMNRPSRRILKTRDVNLDGLKKTNSGLSTDDLFANPLPGISSMVSNIPTWVWIGGALLFVISGAL